MTKPNQVQTDGDLLAEFVASGSQTAFAEIVQRHAGMVHSVCWRVLDDRYEAQDAAQAAFVTLARKAASLRNEPSIGGWLHRVAWCIAQNTRIARSRRQQREVRAMEQIPLTNPPPGTAAGVRDELDRMVNQLPDRYRLPLVLFHLESKSLDETAKTLGLNIKTASTRLVRAREILRQKLVRRGVTVGSVGALTALLSAESGAAVLPATFVASTVSAATGTAAVSASVAALSQGAIQAMFSAKVKTVSLAAAACLAVAGTGVVVAKQLTTPSSTSPATTVEQSTAVRLDSTGSSPVALPPVATTMADTRPAQPQPVLPAGQIAPVTVTANALEMKAEFAKPVFANTEPIRLTVSIKNVLAKDVWLYDLRMPSHYSVRFGDYEAVHLSILERFIVNSTLVKAGETVTIPIELTPRTAELVSLTDVKFHWLGIQPRPVVDRLPPGKYSVTVRRQFKQGHENPARQNWVGELGTDPVTIDITDSAAQTAPAVNEHVAQQLAQLWVSGWLAGRVDQVLGVSDVPFGWDKVELVKAAEELKTKLEDVIKKKGVRNLQAGEATVLKDQEAAQAAERFKMLDTAGLVCVLVKIPNPEKSRGSDSVLVAIKPGHQLKVVGFSD